MGKKYIVFISGLFGARLSCHVLQELRYKYPDCEIHCLIPGPVSSTHDRAIECFYQLKGGTVDYGIEHSSKEGHLRYGKTYKGLIKDWDENNPIHLIGYSFGATTARYLHHLLCLGHFKSIYSELDETSSIETIDSPITLENKSLNKDQPNANWVKSISTIQGCNNGSHLVHMLGLGFDLIPRRFSILWFIFMFFYLCQWFGSWLLEKLFPLEVDHWKIDDYKDFYSYITSSPLFYENAGRDMSPKRMYEINKTIASTIPAHSTTYLAFIATVTKPIFSMSPSYHRPSLRLLQNFPENILLTPLAFFLGFLGRYMHGLYNPDFKFKFLNDESDDTLKSCGYYCGEHDNHLNHFASDAVVSVAGQRNPCFEKSSLQIFNGIESLPNNLEKGIWHNVSMPDHWNHIETVYYGKKQLQFFSDLIEYVTNFC